MEEPMEQIAEAIKFAALVIFAAIFIHALLTD